MEAAERGDAAALQRLAKELQDWKESGAVAAAGNAPVEFSRYQCPVDLSVPFPPQVIERARDLGLVQARTAPLAELAKVLEAIYTHVDQPVPSNPDMEREGVLRSRALAELEIPAELDTEESRVLAGQFIQQIFVNSGGARYLPPPTAETVLLEDFAEDESADGPSKLLAALGFAKRVGHSRIEIESTLMRCGAEILETPSDWTRSSFASSAFPSIFIRVLAASGVSENGRIGPIWTATKSWPAIACALSPAAIAASAGFTIW